MFCPNCGTEVADNVLACGTCGHTLYEQQTTAEDSSDLSSDDSEGSALKGFFILIVSFFSMPIKTIKRTFALLREVGSKGALDIGGTAVPHLTWLVVASNLVASLVVVGLILYGLFSGISGLSRNPASALGTMVGGFFFAVIADWLVMFFIETLSLWVKIANDIRVIRESKSAQ